MELSVDANPRARTAGPSGPAVRFPGRAAWRAWITIAALALLGCGTDRGTDAGTAPQALPRARVPATEIPLVFDVDPDRLEFSSLAWWGDRLLLVPQQPHRVDPAAAPRWYMLERAAIAGFLDGDRDAALRPQPVDFDDDGVRARIAGWDGLEAVAIDEDRLILSVERVVDGRWGSVLVGGELRSDPPAVRLHASTIVEVEGDSGRPNFSEEALVATADGVVALHELYGRRVNEQRRAHRFAWDLRSSGEIAMTVLEYRITDATAADSSGCFWIVNQYWPPEAHRVRPAADALAADRRASGTPVERLVALRLEPDGVEVDRTQGVIEIELPPDGVVRNWEGIARWGEEGFLLVTDRHPRTMLAFVPRR